jgi:hypothetical protein
MSIIRRKFQKTQKNPIKPKKNQRLVFLLKTRVFANPGVNIYLAVRSCFPGADYRHPSNGTDGDVTWVLVSFRNQKSRE